MGKRKTLDDFLDEIDRWSDEMLREIAGLPPKELRNHFQRAQTKLENAAGVKLSLPKVRRNQSQT